MARRWRIPKLRFPVPTGRLVVCLGFVALVVLLVPGAWAEGMTLALNLLLFVLFWVDAALTPKPNRFGVTRQLPSSLTIGQQGALTWSVSNPLRRRVRLAVADELAPSLGASLRRTWLWVASESTQTATVAMIPTRRGRFHPSEVWVRVRGPLGLACRQAPRELRGELRVYPPFRSKDEAELRVKRSRILEVGLRSAMALGQGTEFEQLREYGPDDDSRRIDWAATARFNKPIVRTYRAERNQTCLVLLDNGRGMAARVGERPRAEYAIDATMALTYLSTRLGDKVGLVVFDDKVREVVAPSSHRSQLTAVTDAMFAREPALVESDPEAALSEAASRFRRRAMVVVLTELDASSAERTLLPAIPVLARTHLVVVAAVRDSQLERWATSTPAVAAMAYQRSAAIATLDERRRLIARLRSLGATVIDASPGRLAPALCDAYLHAKARGGL